MKGNLVAIEGIDGAGKTTVVQSLKNEFSDAIFTKEPTETWIGEVAIESLSKSSPLTQLFLFLADHSNHIERTIKPGLEEEKLIICDRYIASRYAYQGSQGIDTNWIEDLHKDWSINPDLTILLDIDTGKAINRTDAPFDKKALKDIRSNYLEFIEKQRKKEQNVIIIDADQDTEKIKKICVDYIKEIIQ